MRSRVCLSFLLCSLPVLILAGCGSSGNSKTSPPPATFTLTVTAPTSGSGTITGPSGINCPGTCSASFAANTQVTLTAMPGSTYTFAGWGGACSGTAPCIITMTANTTVSATFNAGYGLTVVVTGSGTVTSTAPNTEISCPPTCSASFPQNTQITLSETPAAGNSFSGWSGGCTGTAGCIVTLSASTSVTATFAAAATGIQNLNHIILFAQENRSFDHYFGYMRKYWAANGIPDQAFDGLPQWNPPFTAVPPSVPGCQLSSDVSSCTPDPTNPITSFSFDTLVLPSGKMGTVCEENQSPFWNEAHNDWSLADPADQTGNPAALDGFAYTAAYDARSNGLMDVNGARAMGYYTDTDLNLAYALATDFGTSDRWFSPVMDRTQINRAYIYAATSQGYAYPPGGGINDNAPFSAKTIFEALQDAGISWKIYVDPTNTPCENLAAGQSQDLCLANNSYMNQFTYETTIQNDPSNNLWQHFAPISQFAIDVQDDSTFPAYAMIEPPSSAGDDEHPSDTDISPVNIQLGETFFQQSILKPFLQSPTWNDSVLVLTYDEAGGLYDHVSPQPAMPPGDYLSPFDLVPPSTGKSGDICTNPGQVLGQGTCTFGWTGYRVPLVVISPFSKTNFVSHTTRDTTAVLTLVETRFGLPALTARDASYATTTAAWDEFFDFVNKPNATPPTLPTQSLTGNCDQTPAAVWNEPPEVTVTVNPGGTATGTGQINSSPGSAIVNCGTECTGVFATGTVVTLTATPTNGSTFVGWGVECSGATTCSVTVGTHDYVTATFNP